MALRNHLQLSLVAVALVVMFWDKTVCASRKIPPRYIKKCGGRARNFLRWYCSDDTFRFPFPFSQEHVVIRYPPPDKRLYPFQHQASVCCRRGCQEIGFLRMCWYHKVLERCERNVNVRTDRGRKQKADCLLEVDKKLQPSGMMAAPKSRRIEVQKDLMLYEFANRR